MEDDTKLYKVLSFLMRNGLLIFVVSVVLGMTMWMYVSSLRSM